MCQINITRSSDELTKSTIDILIKFMIFAYHITFRTRDFFSEFRSKFYHGIQTLMKHKNNSVISYSVMTLDTCAANPNLIAERTIIAHLLPHLGHELL